MGHPAAVRSRQRRLRLVRRADQLRDGGRLRHRRRAAWRSGGRPTCTSSARTSRASTPWCGRRCCGAPASTLPQQVFGHGWVHFGGQRMSKSLGTSVDPVGRGAAVRPGPAAAVPHQGDLLRRRRRLHVGALRGALQRRPRQQPRQPGEPRRCRWPRSTAVAAWRRPATAAGCRRSPGRRSRATGAAMDALRAARRRGRGVPDRRRRQRVHRRERAVDAGQGSGQRRTPRRRAVRGGRSRARRGGAAAAGDAVVVRGDPAARRRTDAGEPTLRLDDAGWQSAGEAHRRIQGAPHVAAVEPAAKQGDHRDRTVSAGGVRRARAGGTGRARGNRRPPPHQPPARGASRRCARSRSTTS